MSGRVITPEEAIAIAEGRMCYHSDARDCARSLVDVYAKLGAADEALATARLERDRAYIQQDNAVSRKAAMDAAVRELLAIETDEDDSADAVVRRSRAKVRLLAKLAGMIEVPK